MFKFETLEDFSIKISFCNALVIFASARKSQSLLGCSKLKFLNQTHSSTIAELSATENEVTADGWFIRNSDIPGFNTIPAIRTSDCMPLALINNQSCCLLHVGWRGLKNGIVEQALNLMKPSVAILGPCARACCYEVKEDVLDTFGVLAVYRKAQDKYLLDLPAILTKKLLNIPVLDLNVCTICNPNFFSYRRKDKGSNLTLLCSPEIQI